MGRNGAVPEELEYALSMLFPLDHTLASRVSVLHWYAKSMPVDSPL
jgi:hypothetical protein